MSFTLNGRSDTPLKRWSKPIWWAASETGIGKGPVCNPSILILDEATSALDAETESKLIANLTRRGCTQVIVAYRLSTIRDADLILVMDKEGDSTGYSRDVVAGSERALCATDQRSDLMPQQVASLVSST